MASYRDSLREEEVQNWIKAALALNITKEGLQIFVEEVLTCVHQDIYNNVRTSKGLPGGATCVQCFTENVLKCSTPKICTSKKNCKFHYGPLKQYVPCPNGICEGVRDEIVQHHRFSGPSWKNTNADKWSTIPWEIAKCFLPPDGYKTVSSIKDSDFNGVISVMMNCEDFQNKLSFIVATQSNLLTEVRDIGRRIRHSHDQRVKDTELVGFLGKLRTLLEDKTELANRPEALHAVEQLKKLETDDFKISAENEGEILKEGLRLRLANHYRTTLADMPISPILGEKNAKLRKFYVAPKIVEKDHRKIDNQESGQKIAKFSDVFIKEDQFLRNVFLVGEPGNGKSTFSVMCALDWTHQYLPAEENVGIKTSFADPEFFKEFAFLFHVTLRDAGKTCGLAQMIKDQLIRKIYHEKDADDGYRLLQTVLESETCLIIADGLDEWTHPENLNCTCNTEERVIPFRNSANKATLLTTTRPWRMSQFRVQDSKIDKYLEIEGAADTKQLVENIINILNGGNEDERTPEAFMEMVSEKGLEGLLSAPISITQLVCLWFEGKSLTDSKCDIYAGVINMLSCRLSYMQSGIKIPKIELPSVLKKHKCFTQNPMVYLALAKLAYTTLFSECRDSSVVFSNTTVNALLIGEQVEFALKSGLLTEKKSNSLMEESSHFSFFHKTLQEFLAALHLCLNENDYSQLSSKYEQDNKENILGDVSQTFIFICGMKPELGVQMSSWINSSRPDVSSWINSSIPPYQPSIYNREATLLQDLILSGNREARANNYGDIPLYLAHFYIHSDVDVVVLKKLMMINKERIQSLNINECNDQINGEEVQEVITSNSDSLKAVSLWERDGQYDLSQCHRLEYLHIEEDNTTRVQVDPTHITRCDLHRVSSNVEMYIFRLFKHDQRWSKLQRVMLNSVKNVQLLVNTLPSLPPLQSLYIGDTDLGELHLLPPASITDITLWSVTMTAEAVRSLIETMKNIPHTITCNMGYCPVKPASERKDIREHMNSSPSFEVLVFHNTGVGLHFKFTKM
ncbi:uncharacterized protein LOC128246636 [Mya arenaria]|uniref:uncharacterized protein LOC128246636 n=1 Tax=Mya arenaria TaxID=6604 RepID=UPI0022E97D97|nr:uncharacterized protein LOC128246636 [Mya arenaria]XP_052820893.1 uncharacterized protein LOC128246636 [Mya arenaria]XP_052820894.1 uncharacterized protein LOC128246636 [Mya arenaria]XP_052820895.1 uncharacterized protein LOC128246636 [Mya arenaria]